MSVPRRIVHVSQGDLGSEGTSIPVDEVRLLTDPLRNHIAMTLRGHRPFEDGSEDVGIRLLDSHSLTGGRPGDVSQVCRSVQSMATFVGKDVRCGRICPRQAPGVDAKIGRRDRVRGGIDNWCLIQNASPPAVFMT